MAWVRAGSTGPTCITQAYDTTQLKLLKAAGEVWQREESGEGTRVIDNRGTNMTGLTAINSAFPKEQGMFPMPTGAGGPVTGTPGTPTPVPGGNKGCACTVQAAGAGGLGAALMGLAFAAVVLRRRRKSPGTVKARKCR